MSGLEFCFPEVCHPKMTDFIVEQTGTAEIDTGAYPPEGVASNKTLKYCTL